MNEVTIHGNVTAEPVLHRSADGQGATFLTFGVAVNRRYYASARGGWKDLPTVYHQVIARYELAENAATTLTKGMAVTVTGQFADNSFTPNGSDQVVRRHRLEATDLAVSLRFATAVVSKRVREQASAEEPAA